MYYTCRHFFFPLHWSEKCGGGPVISPFFCSGHHGWRDIIHFFWHPFQSSLGGATGQGCHPRPAEGLADAAFSWPGWNNVLCFTAGARGSKEWQLCPFNLYALPASSSLVPSPHLLSQWFQRLIYLLWLYSEVQDSVESAIWPNVRKKPVSFPFHWLTAILKGRGLLPRTPDILGWCQWVLFLDCFVGSVVMTYPQWNKTEKAQGAHLYSTVKGNKRICPKLFHFSLLSTSGSYHLCTGRDLFWVYAVKCFELGKCGQHFDLMESLGFHVYLKKPVLLSFLF